MATSDSDDFESADEEVEFHGHSPRQLPTKWTPQCSAIDSDTDDDNDCITPTRGNYWSSEISDKKCNTKTTVSNELSTSSEKIQSTIVSSSQSSQLASTNLQVEIDETINREKKETELNKSRILVTQQNDQMKMECKINEPTETYGGDKSSDDRETIRTKLDVHRKERTHRQQKQRESHKPSKFGATKLGVKIPSNIPKELSNETSANLKTDVSKDHKEPSIVQECWEFDDDKATKILQRESLKSHENAWHRKKSAESSNIDDELANDNIPDELKSDKKFKEIFNNNGWNSFVDEKKIIDDFDSETKMLKRLDEQPINNTSNEITPSGGSWSSWSSWGVNSLINTASVGVSTLTNHVAHGLTLLEESIGAPDPAQIAQSELSKESESTEEKIAEESQIGSFGFSNLMSGVSSITKLVETTGTKVISGGLGTLETIGKKTMEVLQEGDPGLKKKRAFFMNEIEKPILSQILREAKEKAEITQKSVEEKQQARKVHFETLFDDFQGLVHLEALEMLSKQSNMKIQQRLVALDADEMISIQETLDEVKELCDLGDDDEDDEEEGDDKDLKKRLRLASADLGVEISYEKLYQLWEKTKSYVLEVSDAESLVSNKEIFQNAISSLAQFTADCVERFHKTSELLLIKERRSTVNEADALVQLTKILSSQIGIVANLFSKCLNDRTKRTENTDDKVDITTIFLEAANASSYIQDAFRLLIPIIQVGTM